MDSADRQDSRPGAVLLAATGVLATIGAITFALAVLLPPDPPAATAVAEQFLRYARNVRPEPAERLIFLANLILLPVIALVAALAARATLRATPRLASHGQLPRTVALGAVALAAGCLANSHGMRRMFLMEEGTSFVVVFLLALSLAAAALAASRGTEPRHRARATWVVFVVAGLSAVYLTFSWRMLRAESLVSSFRHHTNLDAVLYPIVQATSGGIPLVDYWSQYGLYAALIVPWFDLLGVSVWSFTLVMNLLQLAAVLAILGVIFREFRNLAIAFAASAAVLYVTGAYAPLRFDPDPYFQYMPVRLFFPALSALLVGVWMRAPRPRTTALISVVAGLAIIWNVDSGIAVAGGWLAFLGFRAIASAVSRRAVSPALRQFGVAASCVALPLLAFAVLVRWRASATVDFSMAVEAHQRFFATGFFMLPLPRSAHAWQLIAAVYIAGIVLGAFHSLGSVRDRRAALAQYLSFLGLGLFAYYQGRSADQVLVAVSWPAVLVTFLLADWLWESRRLHRVNPQAAGLIVGAALTFGALCALILVRDLPGLTRLGRSNWSSRGPTPVTRNVAFLRERSRASDSAWVLARFQAVYLAEASLSPGLSGQSSAEVITTSQGLAHVQQIERARPRNIFLGEPYLDRSASNPYAAIFPILDRDYELTDRTGGREELRLYARRAP